MKWPGARTGACRHPDHYINGLIPSVMCFCQVIYHLVKAAAYKIGKLHLNHCLIAIQSEAHSRTYDTRFANGCVPYAVAAELLHEALCYFKYAAVFGNILPHYYQVIIFAHG